MPHNFYIKINNSEETEYSCRESAASEFVRGIFSGNVRRGFKLIQANTPATVSIKIYGGLVDPVSARLVDFFKEALPIEVTTAVNKCKDIEWSSVYGLHVVLTGPIHHVYHAMWWAILLMRLALLSDLEDTVEKQLNNSDGDDNDLWFEDYDKHDAIEAYKVRHTINAAAILLFERGPAQHKRAQELYDKEFGRLL